MAGAGGLRVTSGGDVGACRCQARLSLQGVWAKLHQIIAVCILAAAGAILGKLCSELFIGASCAPQERSGCTSPARGLAMNELGLPGQSRQGAKSQRDGGQSVGRPAGRPARRPELGVEGACRALHSPLRHCHGVGEALPLGADLRALGAREGMAHVMPSAQICSAGEEEEEEEDARLDAASGGAPCSASQPPLLKERGFGVGEGEGRRPAAPPLIVLRAGRRAEGYGCDGSR